MPSRPCGLVTARTLPLEGSPILGGLGRWGAGLFQQRKNNTQRGLTAEALPIGGDMCPLERKSGQPRGVLSTAGQDSEPCGLLHLTLTREDIPCPGRHPPAPEDIPPPRSHHAWKSPRRGVHLNTPPITVPEGNRWGLFVTCG